MHTFLHVLFYIFIYFSICADIVVLLFVSFVIEDGISSFKGKRALKKELASPWPSIEYLKKLITDNARLERDLFNSHNTRITALEQKEQFRKEQEETEILNNTFAPKKKPVKKASKPKK